MVVVYSIYKRSFRCFRGLQLVLCPCLHACVLSFSKRFIHGRSLGEPAYWYKALDASLDMAVICIIIQHSP
jgi:hypothetical protein